MRIKFLQELSSLYWLVAFVAFVLSLANPLWTAVYAFIFYGETGRWSALSALILPAQGLAWKFFILVGLGISIHALVTACVHLSREKSKIAAFLGIDAAAENRELAGEFQKEIGGKQNDDS